MMSGSARDAVVVATDCSLVSTANKRTKIAHQPNPMEISMFCISHRHVTKRLAAALISVTAAIAFSGVALADKTRIQAGVLECRGDGGWGAIIASRKTFECLFSNVDGQAIGRYEAVVHKFGLDIGVTGKTALQWVVLGPASRIGGNYVAGTLEGEYAGVGADAAVGAGLGANALIGGGVDSLALQPLSVQAQAGLNIAAGVQTMLLTYRGPAS